jgi:hypothetical protein
VASERNDITTLPEGDDVRHKSHGFDILVPTSYSPDLAPSDFFLFGYVRHQLQGHEFTEGAELVSAISEFLNQIPTDTLVDVLTTG